MLSKLSSMRLAISLMLVIAFACVLGTLIPQHEEALEQHLSADAYRALTMLELDQVYTSRWFLGLVALLALNILLCTLKNYKESRYLIREKTPPIPGRRSYHAVRSDKLPELIEKLNRHFDQEFDPDQTAMLYYKRSEQPRHLSTILLHLSILLIILGMGMRSFGMEGFTVIFPGQETNTIQLSPGTHELGFMMRCENFTVETYENGMPKEFRSVLSFWDQGQLLLKDELLVNHPISFRGLRFYQSGYQGAAAAQLRISAPNLQEEFTISAGQTKTISDRIQIHAVKMSPNLMEMGPAVQLEIITDNSPERLILFQDIELIRQARPNILQLAPSFDPDLVPPYHFELHGLTPVYSTGITVSRDPGMPVTAAGAIGLLAGIMLTLLMPRRETWVEINFGSIAVASERNWLPATPPARLQTIINDHIVEGL